MQGGAPILLLTGPPGSGKTATVVVIARKHDIYIEEWSNPLTTPFSVSRQAGMLVTTNIYIDDFIRFFTFIRF